MLGYNLRFYKACLVDNNLRGVTGPRKIRCFTIRVAVVLFDTNDLDLVVLYAAIAIVLDERLQFHPRDVLDSTTCDRRRMTITHW